MMAPPDVAMNDRPVAYSSVPPLYHAVHKACSVFKINNGGKGPTEGTYRRDLAFDNSEMVMDIDSLVDNVNDYGAPDWKFYFLFRFQDFV